jgi:hypothetical protein
VLFSYGPPPRSYFHLRLRVQCRAPRVLVAVTLPREPSPTRLLPVPYRDINSLRERHTRDLLARPATTSRFVARGNPFQHTRVRNEAVELRGRATTVRVAIWNVRVASKPPMSKGDTVVAQKQHGETSETTPLRNSNPNDAGGSSSQRRSDSRASRHDDSPPIAHSHHATIRSPRHDSVERDAPPNNAPAPACGTAAKHDYSNVKVARVSLVDLLELQAPIDDPVTLATHPLPWQPASVELASPRSLEACRMCGVDPHTELQSYSIKYFSRLTDKGADKLAWRRSERHKAKLGALIAQLLLVRDQIIAREGRSASAASSSPAPPRSLDFGGSPATGKQQHHSDTKRAATSRERSAEVQLFLESHDPHRIDADGWVYLTEDMQQAQNHRDSVAQRREALEALRARENAQKLHAIEMRTSDATVRRHEVLSSPAARRSLSVTSNRHRVPASARHADPVPTVSRGDEVRWRRELLNKHGSVQSSQLDARLRIAADEAERRRRVALALRQAQGAGIIQSQRGVGTARAKQNYYILHDGHAQANA